MKTTFNLRSQLGGAAVRATVLLVAGAALTSSAHAVGPASDAVFAEVMRECRHKSVSEAMIFVSAAPLGQVVATPAEEAVYLSNDKYFHSANARSKCWTRERWERFVRARLAEDRVQFGPKQ